MKRLIDIVASTVGIVLLSPLLLVAAALVRLSSPGPVLFRQERIGRGFRPFTILKFRTMVVDAPRLGAAITCGDDPRITTVGRFLRKTKLDELPQLLSVLRGDMSLVGPRPALHNQHELIAARRSAGIDALRPGITGWAQVNGRDDLSDERKLAFDREYLDRAGVGFDLRILVLTVLRVARRDGVAH